MAHYPLLSGGSDSSQKYFLTTSSLVVVTGIFVVRSTVALSQLALIIGYLRDFHTATFIICNFILTACDVDYFVLVIKLIP